MRRASTSWLTNCLQIVPEITYYVSGGALNRNHSSGYSGGGARLKFTDHSQLSDLYGRHSLLSVIAVMS